ncbi:hypothetical protein TcG_09747 [Trypanosoma cruzi]|nr:hypothetical protein TcG_09747 [Trypanosoma cruzi]
MAREHAATPHAVTQEEKMTGEKQEAAQTHGGNKHQSQEKHRHGPHTGRQLHTSPHKHTIAVLSVREREDSVLHTTNAHAASIHPKWKMRRDTAPLPPVQPHGQRDTTTARFRYTEHSERTITQRATRGSDSLSIHDAVPQSMRSHGERTISSIQLILRPSLTNASVSDGP